MLCLEDQLATIGINVHILQTTKLMEVLVPNDKYSRIPRETFFLHLDDISAEMVSQLFLGTFL